MRWYVRLCIVVCGSLVYGLAVVRSGRVRCIAIRYCCNTLLLINISKVATTMAAAVLTVGRIDECNSDKRRMAILHRETRATTYSQLAYNWRWRRRVPAKKAAAFPTVMRSSTYKVLRTLAPAALPATNTHRELTVVISTQLAPRPLAIAERFKLRQTTHARAWHGWECCGNISPEL